MRDEQKNYVIAGGFVVGMLVLLVVWMSTISGKAGPTETYRIHFSNVMGLSTGTQIYYAGYPLGYIDSMEPMILDGKQKFELTIGLKDGWKIPDDSLARLGSAGLLSAVVVNIEPGTSSSYLESGDIIPSLDEEGMMSSIAGMADEMQLAIAELRPALKAVSDSAPELVANINTSVENVSKILNDENAQNVTSIVANLEALSSDLKNTNKQLQDIFVDVDGLLEKNDQAVNESLENLSFTLETVADHIHAVASNLESTTHNLKDFSRQVRKNPSVLLLGVDEEYKDAQK
jgi:phospholipid/cholesterol/gamma-HCH transport system substrate-binding protein